MKKDYTMTPKDRLCISVDEMGKRLGICRVNAYELANTEGFPSIRLGRRLLVPVMALERWLEAQAGGGAHAD